MHKNTSLGQIDNFDESYPTSRQNILTTTFIIDNQMVLNSCHVEPRNHEEEEEKVLIEISNYLPISYDSNYEIQMHFIISQQIKQNYLMIQDQLNIIPHMKLKISQKSASQQTKLSLKLLKMD